MANLSTARAGVPLLRFGLDCINRGKVRDTYKLDDRDLRLLSVATDGISIFDFVLNALVPMKGIILSAMSHFWFQKLKELGINTHFLAYGADIDSILPPDLRGNPEIQARAMVVRKLNMHPVEFIIRGHITGTGLKAYKETGVVCGHRLSPGLQDGDRLPRNYDTPTTKAVEGHDEHINADQIRKRYPEETYLALAAYQIGHLYAETRGINLADTKFEFGIDDNGQVCLGDEVLTPDSSRYWPRSEWQVGRKPAEGRKAPPPYDKQLVRNWGIEMGINKLDPTKPEDLAKVQAMEVPAHLITATTQTYRYIFWRLTGHTIENYLGGHLGVKLGRPKKKVAVVVGSESDLVHVRKAVAALPPVSEFGQIISLDVHVMSCHRNPGELRQFVADGCRGANVVVAAGGKALALPGVLDAEIHFQKAKHVPVIGVALGEPESEALLAAQLSIEELPSQPVVLDEVSGKAYTGVDGLIAALKRVDTGELPPPKPRKEAPAQLNVDLSKK